MQLCAAHTLEQIRSDWVKQLALERCFEIVGEAIKRLPADLRSQHPGHDWRGAVGARDRIAHGYEWVDHALLYQAVKERFPELLTVTGQMLADLGGELPTEEM